MHLCNFGKCCVYIHTYDMFNNSSKKFIFSAVNVQPNPVKFVQLTTEYWEPFGDNKKFGWINLGYKFPNKTGIPCHAGNFTADPSQCPEYNTTVFEGKWDPLLNASEPLDFILCQVCPEGVEPWNYGDWLFTMGPGVFGLVPGIANPTGVILIIILTIMVICSMPCVRRSGNFEAFAWTHYVSN